MNKPCRKTDYLLHLYGELSERERSFVDVHIKYCPGCDNKLRRLLEISDALRSHRAESAKISSDPSIVENVIARIGRYNRPVLAVISLIDRRLKPAFGTVIFAAACLFFVQQIRDISKLTDLEESLDKEGNFSHASMSVESASLFLPSDPGSLSPSSSKTDELFGRPHRTFRSLINSIEGEDAGLIERMAKKYPHLSRVTVEDGIDDAEKQILSTEGKAFLTEFEKLLY